jgi:tRNA-Thr(GGU) m(6)t(6)A37 methyltransferase TsaA
MKFELNAIGYVESPLTMLDRAPRQPDEGAPPAQLVFDEAMLEGLRNLRSGDDIIVLTWLDRAQRDMLTVHPRGDTTRRLEGVFSTRSPHRPNPIGLHRTRVVAVKGCRIGVDRLEALDGTPIVDVKPVLREDVTER